MNDARRTKEEWDLHRERWQGLGVSNASLLPLPCSWPPSHLTPLREEKRTHKKQGQANAPHKTLAPNPPQTTAGWAGPCGRSPPGGQRQADGPRAKEPSRPLPPKAQTQVPLDQNTARTQKRECGENWQVSKEAIRSKEHVALPSARLLRALSGGEREPRDSQAR